MAAEYGMQPGMTTMLPLSVLVTCVLWGLLAFLMWRARAKFRNSVVLLLAVLSTMLLIGIAASGRTMMVLALEAVFVFLFFLIVPVFLIINGITMVKKEGRNIKHLLSLLAGIIVLAGEISGVAALASLFAAHEQPKSALTALLFFFIASTVVYFSIMFLAFMLYTLFMQLIPHTRDFDYIVIHGCGIRADGSLTKLLQERVDKAIAVYRKDATPPYIIPSGGQGADEVRTEASAMKEYLLQNGIPEDMILLEDRSVNTWQNLENSRNLIDAREGRKRVVLITSNYHVYRTLYYCRKIGFKCTGIGAHVAFYYWPSALIREFIAILHERKHLIMTAIGYMIWMCPFIFALIYTLTAQM